MFMPMGTAGGSQEAAQPTALPEEPPLTLWLRLKSETPTPKLLSLEIPSSLFLQQQTKYGGKGLDHMFFENSLYHSGRTFQKD